MFSVKKCQLFEGISPSFSILAVHLKCAQNVHGVSKIDFLRDHHNWTGAERQGAFPALACFILQ